MTYLIYNPITGGDILKDSKLTIRCEDDLYEEYRTICFFEKKKYGDFLKELIEEYKKKKQDK